MQYHHHLQLTHSLVLTFATSLPLRILRIRQRLPPNILEGQLTTLSRISSASVARLRHTPGLRCLLILRTRHIRAHHTLHLRQRHRITPILLRLIRTPRVASRQSTTNGPFRPISRPRTCQILSIRLSLIPKRQIP